jgi:hypothetical protein
MYKLGMVMGVKYPFLEKGLINNPDLWQVVLTYNTEYLTILNKLFGSLYSGGCIGIELKIRECSPDLVRFQSLISEFEFAKSFLENGMQVELLASSVFRGRKAPDMLVKSKMHEYYVEVKKIQLDEEGYEFGNKIVDILNTLGLAFMVVVKTSYPLSNPSYNHQARSQKESDCDAALLEFSNKIKQSSLKSFPVVISTFIADIELHPTSRSKSFFGIEAMQQAITEPPEYRQRIRYDIEQKSRKRDDWIGDELCKVNLVAIDDDTTFFYIDRYNMELFGNATYYVDPTRIPKISIDQQINTSIKKGWEKYLQKMCILGDGRSLISEKDRGLFFTEPYTKNVTAVLVRHFDVFYLLANPLAEEAINNPDIFDDLKKYLIGWEE